MFVKEIEWDPGERMSKEYALSVIDEMKGFYRRLYYQPQTKPFNTVVDFEAKMQTLNGLREMVETSVKE